jgi:hypothetical protein
MRRRVIAVLAALAAAATCAPAVAATSKPRIVPQVHDAAGDWKVASQDVLDATFTATKTQLQADVHLAAPPAVGIHSDYDAVMYVGCAMWSLHFTWMGGAPDSTAQLLQYACPTSSGNPVIDALGTGAVATYPATATVTATGIRIVAAPTKALHRGVKVWGFVETRLEPVVVIVGLDSDNPSIGGDLANDSKKFVLTG